MFVRKRSLKRKKDGSITQNTIDKEIRKAFIKKHIFLLCPKLWVGGGQEF